MGNYWYIVCSEAFRAAWSRKVKYMMATSFEGLKHCFDDPGANWPKDDREGGLGQAVPSMPARPPLRGSDRYI